MRRLLISVPARGAGENLDSLEDARTVDTNNTEEVRELHRRWRHAGRNKHYFHKDGRNSYQGTAIRLGRWPIALDPDRRVVLYVMAENGHKMLSGPNVDVDPFLTVWNRGPAWKNALRAMGQKTHNGLISGRPISLIHFGGTVLDWTKQEGDDDWDRGSSEYRNQ